jgi:D-alanyl-D-alanine carboxypeptidase/D-alanyl-D-alanine-endopeptidase (penicillin-binding protein 4)
MDLFSFRRTLMLAMTMLCFSAAACAQESLPPRVMEQLQALGKTKSPVGACAVRLSDGKELLAWQADKLFAPASNMKVLTSCFALARLGGDFRYTTVIYTSGNDVLVKGDYDPVMGDPVVAAANNKTIYAEMDLWAKAIKADAVKNRSGRPVGNVIVIARGGNYRHKDWPKDQYARWYCAPISELNFNNNCFDVRFNKGKDGSVVPVLSPESRFIQVLNATSPGKGTYGLANNRDESEITVSGKAAYNMTSPVSWAVNNPPLMFGRVLADRIEKAGLKVEGEVRMVPADQAGLDKARPLIQTTTPLSLVMNRADKKSVNMIAEGMFLRAGDGTFEGSAQIETQTLQKEYGLAADSFVICDGSGFSRNDRVSPRAMVTLLAAVLKRPDSKVLLDALPISGTDGTLSKRLKEAPYRGRVLGKTGFIEGVSCLSGYVLDAQGKPAAAYSVLLNHCDISRARQTEEMVCRALVDFLDGKAKTGSADGEDK